LELVARRLEAPLRRMIAESIGPLQAQVAAVKETLARRDANPSRFEVSLSQIPAELEQQLEMRLRKDLGPKVIEESRQHYTQLLEFLHQDLNEKHKARRLDLEQMRASVAAESSRLRQDIEVLDGRIAKLNESARSLESGLDQRLGQMAGNTVKDTRSQLEAMAN